MSERTYGNDIRYRPTRLLEERQCLSQWELPQRKGVSLGRVDYCL